MVPITQSLPIAEQPNLRVYSPEGQYADTDLILCADTKDLATPVAMLQAQFIKYGTIVYQFNTPEDLGKAIVAIDPLSTHDAAALYREQAARDAARAAGTLTPSDPTPAPDSPVVDVPTETATSTPAEVPAAQQDTATTTTPTPDPVPDPAPVVETPAPVEDAPLPPPDPVTTQQILDPLPTDNYLIDGATTTPPDLSISSTTPSQ